MAQPPRLCTSHHHQQVIRKIILSPASFSRLAWPTKSVIKTTAHAVPKAEILVFEGNTPGEGAYATRFFFEGRVVLASGSGTGADSSPSPYGHSDFERNEGCGSGWCRGRRSLGEAKMLPGVGQLQSSRDSASLLRAEARTKSAAGGEACRMCLQVI